MRWILLSVVCVVMGVASAQEPAQTPLVEGKRALAMKQFARAKDIFTAYEGTHPGDVQGELGIADAEPESPFGKQLLDEILANPDEENRGLTEITLQPYGPTTTQYYVSTVNF